MTTYWLQSGFQTSPGLGTPASFIGFFGLMGVLGALFGSFGVTLGLRLASGRTIRGRSECDSCGHTIWARDLVPILGTLLQRFKCRHCGGSITPLYPALELVSGIAFAMAAMRYGLSIWTIVACTAITLMLAIGVADWTHMIVPNRLVVPLLILGLTASMLGGREQLLSSVGGAALGLSLFLAIAIIKRDGMGAGDAKLASALGALLGLPGILPALGVGFVLALIWAVCLLARRKATMKSHLPLGTFLVIGSAIIMLIE